MQGKVQSVITQTDRETQTGRQTDTHLVVIHDSVEGFYPHGVYVSIQNNPLGPVMAHLSCQLPHSGGEQA